MVKYNIYKDIDKHQSSISKYLGDYFGITKINGKKVFLIRLDKLFNSKLSDMELKDDSSLKDLNPSKNLKEIIKEKWKYQKDWEYVNGSDEIKFTGSRLK